MALDPATSLIPQLSSIADKGTVTRKAIEFGVLQRTNKIKPYALLMVVVLGVVARGPIALARLGRVLGEVTGKPVARSSFYDRFTEAFANLMQWLLDTLIEQSATPRRRPPGKLSWFEDVIAADSSVVKVHDDLVGIWRGTRTNSAPAALKVHAWIRVFTGELLSYRITPEVRPDCKVFGVNHEMRNTLILLDQGYSSPSLWRRIQSVGGYFLTWLPADRNPLVTAELRPGRGRARKLTGLRLREALDGLQREVVDITAAFRCTVRKYRSERNRHVTEHFRVVGIRNPETGEYTLFVTNVPIDVLSGKQVARTYRLRWEIESFFKTAKSGSGLAELSSSKPHIVEAMVYASLIRATASMQARAHLQERVDDPRAGEINPLQWHRWWMRQMRAALEELVDRERELTAEALVRMLADPNRGRWCTRRSYDAPPGGR